MAYPNATGQYHLFVDAALGNENNSGGLGLDVGSGGGPQETGCVRIKEIGQARTKLPGLSCGDAGSCLRDGAVPPLPDHGQIRIVNGPPAFMQALIGTRQDVEQVATEDDRAPPWHQVHRGEEKHFLSTYHGMNIHVTDVKYD
jgi:hypothetical protein